MIQDQALTSIPLVVQALFLHQKTPELGALDKLPNSANVASRIDETSAPPPERSHVETLFADIGDGTSPKGFLPQSLSNTIGRMQAGRAFSSPFGRC